jgi:hypothetical protein
MSTKRSRRPSRAVTTGTSAGTTAGASVEIIAAMAGYPLPPGAGSILTGALGGLIAYFTRGGRAGEGD